MGLKKELIVETTTTFVIGKSHIEMVQMAANDIPREKIAETLDISVRTVESHFDKIRKVMKCKTMGGLIAVFFRKNLIK